jgi:hypothetical protein
MAKILKRSQKTDDKRGKYLQHIWQKIFPCSKIALIKYKVFKYSKILNIKEKIVYLCMYIKCFHFCEGKEGFA